MHMITKKEKKDRKGQAVVELLVVLPILFFIILFGYQIFVSIFAAQKKQEQVRARIFDSINYRANGGIRMPSQVSQRVTSRTISTVGLPILGPSDPNEDPISIRIGICRNHDC